MSRRLCEHGLDWGKCPHDFCLSRQGRPQSERERTFETALRQIAGYRRLPGRDMHSNMCDMKNIARAALSSEDATRPTPSEHTFRGDPWGPCTVCGHPAYHESHAPNVNPRAFPPRIAIDADGFCWRVYPTHWSMCPVNPDNSAIPEPVTYYEPVSDATRPTGDGQ